MFLRCFSKIIGLTIKGALVFFCPFTYLKIGTWSKAKVLDFAVITHYMGDQMSVQVLLLIDSAVPELWLCDIKGIFFQYIYKFVSTECSKVWQI